MAPSTRVEYRYRTTGGEFAPWPAGATDYPADLARTTTTQGRTVPYIVRTETGTINRGMYEIALLDDPLAHSRRGWNRRLIYNFGGGCTGGWYREGHRRPACSTTSCSETATPSRPRR